MDIQRNVFWPNAILQFRCCPGVVRAEIPALKLFVSNRRVVACFFAHYATVVLCILFFSSFQLITVADSPHDDRIVALKVRPHTETSLFEQMAVTTAQDGKFKIWTLDAQDDEGINK